MSEKNQNKKIEELVEEFFNKMTIPITVVGIKISPLEETKNDQGEEKREIIDLDIKVDEPQILIGQQGQTLFEVQKILRFVLNKKLQSIFYLNLDINDYKKKKVDYLRDLAKGLADQSSLDKETKTLPPMSAYERRIIHSELSKRADIITESQGEGSDRHIIIKPR